MVVIEYNKEWAIWFNKIKQYLQDNLNHFISIQHIGSTSIPDMIAKPIIDIDIVINNSNFPVTKIELESIGYIHLGDLGIPKREAFKRYKDNSTNTVLDKINHHLYVCPVDSPELKKTYSV